MDQGNRFVAHFSESAADTEGTTRTTSSSATCRDLRPDETLSDAFNGANARLARDDEASTPSGSEVRTPSISAAWTAPRGRACSTNGDS
jgi:hypothetical protein